MTFLMSIYYLRDDGLLEHRRNGDGATEYLLTSRAQDFVEGVERHGGWRELKARAKRHPVRMTMDNIARWVCSSPECAQGQLP